MHRAAEYGVAAHWKYKEDPAAPGRQGRPASTDDMAWLRQLLDWQRETDDPGEFLDSLRFDLGASEVFVFTPKGDVVALPAGCDPRRLRLRRAHRGRAPLRRRPRQRQAGAAGERRSPTATSSRCSPPRRETAGPSPRLADVRQEPARPQQDPGLVLQGAPRGGGRAAARTPSPGRCASRACRCSGCCPAARC